ncbi:golgin subfamily A member 6 6 [Schistosoma japonicum]|nr:golgin subfamily A member 6 6 [Schistosoma japonicum]
MASINNKPSKLKQSLLVNRIQDSMYIDYHVLADILPKPPELPVPREPSFIPNELYNLTINKHYKMKLFVDDSSQSVIYEMKLLIDEVLFNIYEIMKVRIENLTKSYTISIEQIRGACRTQLANTIAVLNGLIHAAKQRDATLIENSLRSRITELESILQQYELDIKTLQTKLKEMEMKYDLLNHEIPHISISRSSSLESTLTRTIPSTVVVIVHEDKSIQVDLIDKKKQSLEKEIKNSLEQIDVLKSALSAVQSQVRSLIDQRDQSEQKVTILMNQLNEMKENYAKLEKQLHNKDIELTTCKQKMISTESRLNEVLASIKNLREENCRLEKDYASNRDNEMEQLKQQLEDLLKNKEILEHECNSLRIKLTRLNQKSKVLEPITENTNNSALREQALIAEIIRLRRDLNRLQEASEIRIRCLKDRLKAFTEETFKRNTLEMKVSQLHTAALKYANQFDQLTPSNKHNRNFTNNNEITGSNGTCRLSLPPVTFPALQNKISQQNKLELEVSLRSTLPSIVGID